MIISDIGELSDLRGDRGQSICIIFTFTQLKVVQACLFFSSDTLHIYFYTLTLEQPSATAVFQRYRVTKNMNSSTVLTFMKYRPLSTYILRLYFSFNISEKEMLYLLLHYLYHIRVLHAKQ